jgi:hypothetical protein
MVELNDSNLAWVAQLQTDRDTGIQTDPSGGRDSCTPETPGDLDFQQALNNSDANI